MPIQRYLLLDTAGSELDVVELDSEDVVEDASITLPDGRDVQILEIYDDSEDLDEGVVAAVVIDV